MSAVGVALGAAGAVVAVLAGIGLLRARDAYDRLHWASATCFFATPLVAAGVAITVGVSAAAATALLTAGVVMLAGPVATHALARAATVRERGPWRAADEEQPRAGNARARGS